MEQMLSNWVKAHRTGKLEETSVRKTVTAEQMEISRLRADLAREDGAGHSWKSDCILREKPAVKYAFIECHRRIWPICVQCRVLRVSVSGFHRHRARRRRISERRCLSDAAVLTHISAIYVARHRAAHLAGADSAWHLRRQAARAAADAAAWYPCPRQTEIPRSDDGQLPSRKSWKSPASILTLPPPP